MAVEHVFRVGAAVAPATSSFRFNGFGRLVITPEEIVLTPDRVTRRYTGVDRIVHHGRSVRLVKARLDPPWYSTALILDDGANMAQALTGLHARGRLRNALLAAGFEVNEVTTWFSLRGPNKGRASS